MPELIKILPGTRHANLFKLRGILRFRIATWNLNTWRNARNGGATNEQQWKWADQHLAADLVVFTEASTPPPASVIANRWTTAHRPQGFPGTSRWGTVIAGRSLSGFRVVRLTQIGELKYELDTQFPGSLTAAAVLVNDIPLATVVGLHLRYRKNSEGTFVGHPANDLAELRKDLKALADASELPLIIAGDFNFDIEDEEIGSPVPNMLSRLATKERKLQSPFRQPLKGTFQQDWANGGAFNLDYMFLSKSLNDHVALAKGGFGDFENALELSDHAPLLVELAI